MLQLSSRRQDKIPRIANYLPTSIHFLLDSTLITAPLSERANICHKAMWRQRSTHTSTCHKNFHCRFLQISQNLKPIASSRFFLFLQLIALQLKTKQINPRKIFNDTTIIMISVTINIKDHKSGMNTTTSVTKNS